MMAMMAMRAMRAMRAISDETSPLDFFLKSTQLVRSSFHENENDATYFKPNPTENTRLFEPSLTLPQSNRDFKRGPHVQSYTA